MNEIVTQPLILKKKSRSSRFSSWSGNANSFRDKLFRGLYIFLLFAMDFIMFIYSINGKLIENGHFNSAVGIILLSGFIFSIFFILLLSFSKMAQNIACGIFTMLFTVMFFYQFGLGDVDHILDAWFNKHAKWMSFICFFPSPWIFGFILGLLIFFAFNFSDAILFVTLVLFFSCGIGVQKNEFLNHSTSEYQEVKEMRNGVGEVQENNIVYMMMPKLPSYHFLSSVRDVNFRDLRDLLVGFYAVNHFEIYPNAFVQKNDTMSNIIDILNQVDYTSETSLRRGFSTFVNDWNFIHGGLDLLNLDENRLYAYFHDEGFGVSMYAMPGFDFCLKGENFYTDRCVVKGYKTVSLYDEKAPFDKNVYALLGEWVLSLQSRDFKSFAKMLINSSHLRNMKILSENRRPSIEGSAAIFDRLLFDFKRDIGGHVYLAYVDLPSDIFIYDEFCNIKPRKEWIALKDNSLYSGGLDDKRKAYVDQAKCLIGKLQEYMEEMDASGKLDKTDIYIQGVSPLRELAGVVGDQYSRFVTDNLVNLAIRKGKKPKFLINANVCLASDFTRTRLYTQNYCYSVDNMKNFSTAEVINLKKNLINNSIIRGSKITNIVANYQDWYEIYKANSASYREKMRLKKLEEEERQAVRLQQQRAKETPAKANVSKKSLFDENIFVPTEDDMVIDVDNEEVEDKGEVDVPMLKKTVLQGLAPIAHEESKEEKPAVEENNEPQNTPEPVKEENPAVKENNEPQNTTEPVKEEKTVEPVAAVESVQEVKTESNPVAEVPVVEPVVETSNTEEKAEETSETAVEKTEEVPAIEPVEATAGDK